MKIFQSTKITCIIALTATVLTGSGEFLLHYDSLARYGANNPYEFFSDIPVNRLSTGHFLAVAGIPFYFIGSWHIYLMLKPSNEKISFLTFLISSFGFIYGAIWMGSRAFIAVVVQSLPGASLPEALQITDFYAAHYESLLQVIRVTTLVLSILIVWLTLKGKTRFPRWMAAVAPIFGILACFLVFLFLPSLGKYIMPIALNVAFLIFFSCSFIFGNHIN